MTNENMESSLEKSEKLSDECQDDDFETAFDFEKFCVSIKKSILDNSSNTLDVELESYLLAYQHLYNFFLLLGTAFQFVAMDVKNKIKILKSYQKEEKIKSQSVVNFLTVRSMIKYEKENNLLKQSGYVSGSRTLLRLHRGLDFLRKFLSELYNAQNNVKLGGIARQVYDCTLAEYHSWVVRNTARVAMQFLPNRSDLLNKITNNDEETLSKMLSIFPETLESMNSVYERVQDIYSSNDLLNLP